MQLPQKVMEEVVSRIGLPALKALRRSSKLMALLTQGNFVTSFETTVLATSQTRIDELNRCLCAKDLTPAAQIACTTCSTVVQMLTSTVHMFCPRRSIGLISQ